MSTKSASPIKLHTISQAAKRLGIAKGTLHNWLAAGKISSLTDERGVHLFTEEAIAAAAKKGKRVLSSSSPLSPISPSSPLLSLSQAARVLGISKGTLLRWERAGVI